MFFDTTHVKVIALCCFKGLYDFFWNDSLFAG